ncbi:hypothetical protein GCM10027275_43290 [Rhabdobacter roseus]|uniref:4-alpha-glucanotransferase n=1 Tax=Rhabdobacter roseus TaxID=1655419 RepID=A0A840TQJ1_9BACT|nr:malto-oligosyltrehalose synthase [Rhabdobacter roseus]MBB5286616.1 malto-oligosyltrehalose synthase/4-alpha-glucanotransferase [Rhabdobacter roseus]
MYNPGATYRIQFHKEFSFADFEKIIPYLQKLGISTVYASPILESTPGSTHGYDAVNPHEIDPELGDQEQLTALSEVLKEQGIGWLQDIVPNHMAFDPSNPWLMDVLEKGEQSEYAPFFDIAWNSPLYQGSIMVPFLGAPLEEVIEAGELKVAYDGDRLVFSYFDTNYPLHPNSYASLLVSKEDKPNEAVQQILEQLDQLNHIEDAKSYSAAWDELRMQLAALMKAESTKKYLQKRLADVNASAGLLEQLADEQCYRLCNWQETDNQINFRRFFTVNGLICLNIQDDEVFQHYHALIKTLIDAGLFQGLRVDHIDGLYDPSRYLEQLRELAGEEAYLVVEKILEAGEVLPTAWPIQGNTGYDFLGQVNNLFTYKASEEAFTDFYHQLVGDTSSPATLQREKKAYILYESMAGELENLYQLFIKLNLIDKRIFASIHKEDMKNAIGEFLIQCPVYRYYGNQYPLQDEEAAAVQQIINRVRRYDPELRQAVGLLEDVLLRKPHEGNQERNERTLHFYQRCMQFTGPLMAKGVEDTLMYTYHRFIGHNEVGDSPESFGCTIDEFHQLMRARQEQWPLSLNATSTHDTKRGEDVRARLNVLTELPEAWMAKVEEWQEMNQVLKDDVGPDANEEYFIYQTLVGAYPMPGEDEDDFANRLEEYLQKAMREAKLNSNWTEPDEEYEAATKAFASGLLDQSRPFWKSFQDFHQKVADYGIVNSLGQVLLKFTAPGTPDVYQGCELWDLSLVDPDNRRAVDYAKRQQWLDELLEAEENPARELWQHRHDGRIKLWLTQQLFALRRQQPDVFAQGEYLPLEVKGAYQEHVIAFARKYHRHWYLVALPLHTARLVEEQGRELLDLNWKDTRILLPEGTSEEWELLMLDGKATYAGEIPVQSLFEQLPFAVLKGKQADNVRSAGILLHISSLASPFGIGDLGPEARAFAQFLQRGNQRYWQLLPLNPTEAKQGHSPYSATSSRAGNPLLISPELLAREGLLPKNELSKYHLPQTGQTNYADVERVKGELLRKAYVAYKTAQGTSTDHSFEAFCEQNASWLHDFALYMVLKEQHQGQAWFEWPEALKLRDPKALEELARQEADKVREVKWQQYVFIKQWKDLRAYCNDKSIELLGDLPIYVSYDSADVWADRDLFHLDEDGKLTGIAGVPPDAFSTTGQLWGMPVYQWEVLKEQGYAWWVDRLKRNMELFDLVRLDHFRGFAAYWEVPGGEETAVNGLWVPGPGADFFEAVQAELGELPFVAEDLGDIDAAVLRLRDQFNLPGMKVLHFAFSDNMPRNEYIPHQYSYNFIAYTGTHDNNTTRGWYRQEADEATRRRLELYVGHSVSEEDVHRVMARLAYASVAKIAILPIQDVLGLDETARMNIPASTEANWAWRLRPGQLTTAGEKQLQEWTWLYNRD